MKNLKKSLALILSLALIASLFVSLGAVTASAATEAEGKRDLGDTEGIWWYSDIRGIGFRVVCEPDSIIEVK